MKGKNKNKSLEHPLSNELAKDFNEYLSLQKDPLFLGFIAYKLLEERENTNRILKNLLQRIEHLETKLSQNNHKPVMTVDLLSDTDRKILDFVSSRGKVTAEDVRIAFKYKGRNAASSRLNKLCAQGLLVKKQVGRKMYFMLGKV